MMTNKLTFLLLSAGALGLVGVTAATIGDAPAGAAASTNVVNSFVTNTSANPVPMMGLVAVSGTVPVTGTVAVSGSVAMRELDRIGGEPVTVTGTFSAPAGPDGLAILYDVPPGKVLIVDDVSGGSLGPDDSSSIAVQLRGSKPDGAFATVGWLHCNHDRWHGFGRQMRLYFFPGGVDALFRRDDDLSSWNGYVSLTGRLVDYPAL